MGNLLTRTITGAGIVLVIAGSLLLHPLSMALLGLIIVTGSLIEYGRLVLKESGQLLKTCMIASGIFVYILMLLVSLGIVERHLALLLFLVPPVIFSQLLTGHGTTDSRQVALALAGVTYFSVSTVLIPVMSLTFSGIDPLIHSPSITYSPTLVLGFFILLWINDTGAYLVGSAIGKHKLSEKISPGKSWEGLIGGIIFSLTASLFIGGLLGGPASLGWIGIALITSIGGTLGDLLESALKREAGVKDSGTILPGHGGFLDRFDGFYFAFPLVFIYVSLFG